MSIGILGQKIGMTRVYDEAGVSTPVTVISAEPNVVLQVKGLEKDKYQAIQVGFSEQKEQRLSKPVAGHFKKAGVSAKRFVREFRLAATGEAEYKVGDQIKVDRFTVGQTVDIIGISKGKGFQGPMKKHNFHGQGAAHGSKTHRRNGAVGQRSTPGRIFKNMGMAGHMGDEKVTVQNLRVIQVRPDDNTLVISGAIPGAAGNLVVVRTAIKGQPRVKKIVSSKPANPMKEAKKGGKK